MEPIDWNAKVQEALGRTEFMAISTVGNDGSWTNPVAYAYSEKLELFFISMMTSKHAQNILKNSQVSGAIYKTERFEDGEVLGLQFAGKAIHLTDVNEVARASRYYLKSNDELGAEWQFFKIVPDEVWCFDSRVFGEERRQIDMTALNLKPKN